MWITEYRRAHGLTVADLAAKVYRLSIARRSRLPLHADGIIARLEEEPGFVTLPSIADLIARACDATDEQRDELVLDKYRRAKKAAPAKNSVLRQLMRGGCK